MKKFNILLSLILFCCVNLVNNAFAQNEEKTIKLKFQKEVNGKTTTIEKTYNSLEEMKNDPELKDMNLNLSGDGNFFFSEGKNGKVDITIKKGDGDNAHKNHFFFKVDDDSDVSWQDESQDIEVIKGEDGKVTVLRNGKPIEDDGNITVHQFNSTDTNDIEHIKVKKLDDGTKVIVINGEKEIEFDGDIDEEIDEKVEVIINSLKDGDAQGKNTFQISIRKVKIHIKDINKDDESLRALNLDNKKALKLENLSYYPNPTDGQFNLKFTGKAAPTEIKILDLMGKVVYSDSMPGFEGQYDNNIDLNDQSKGVYIMQILQGNRALNKKIVIE